MYVRCHQKNFKLLRHSKHRSTLEAGDGTEHARCVKQSASQQLENVERGCFVFHYLLLVGPFVF